MTYPPVNNPDINLVLILNQVIWRQKEDNILHIVNLHHPFLHLSTFLCVSYHTLQETP
jgi:hypothetical protein